MCINKIYIRDLYRLSSVGTYYACGRCSSCRQQSANRRARRIRQHSPNGTSCFFVTLTYDNEHVPYVLKSDIINGNNSLYDNSFDKYYLTVYRDSDPYKNEFNILDDVEISTHYSDREISKINSVVSKKSSDIDKVSVCFTPDIQKFLKRFRIRLSRQVGQIVPVSYYFAPEYGPSTQRYHAHLLIWLPNSFSLSEIRHHIIATWPYADFTQLMDDKWCDYAKCASNYLASYVNCSSDLSQFLFDEFRPKPSHSLGFGFDNEHFTLSKILEKFSSGRVVTYPTIIKTVNGVPTWSDIPYPQYVIYRYFPRIIGYGRLSMSTLRAIYRCPQTLLWLSNSQTYLTDSGVLKKQTLFKDVYGLPLYLSEAESMSFFKRVIRVWLIYFLPLGYSYIDYTELIFDFYTALASERYKLSQQHLFPEYNAYEFFNLSDIRKGKVSAPTLLPYISNLTDNQLDANEFPNELQQSFELINKFNKNIKQRKLNTL